MAGPIGYTPPANPNSAMPIEPNSFHGLNPLPGMAAASAAMAPAEAQIQKSEQFDTQAAQAAKFQKLLQSGQQGMQSYIQDVGKTNPELAAQFTQEFNTVAPFMQNLKGKELTEFAFNTYDSWNGRMNAQKMSKYIGANPEAPMTELLGQSGASITPEKQLTIKGTDDLRKSTIAKNEADTEYTKNKPGLQLQLQQMKDNARVRAARMRATKDAKGTAGYQYTYNGTKKSLEEVNADLKDLTDKIAKDPIMGKFEGNVTMLNQLRQERRGLEAKMYRAVEKGAKPDEWINDDSPPNLGQPGATAADSGLAPTAPAGPKTSFGGVSSKSTPDQITAYLKAINPAKTPTPQDIERYRQALATDEASGGR